MVDPTLEIKDLNAVTGWFNLYSMICSKQKAYLRRLMYNSDVSHKTLWWSLFCTLLHQIISQPSAFYVQGVLNKTYVSSKENCQFAVFISNEKYVLLFVTPALDTSTSCKLKREYGSYIKFDDSSARH